MKANLSIVLVLVFTGLSTLHFYWAIGGQWGFSESLPTDVYGNRLLNPKALESAIVGSGLLVFAIFYVIQSDLVYSMKPHTITKIIGWTIPSIFLLRAIGDFKYIGIFKPPIETTFAKADLYFYSPLCLFIALFGYIIIKSNN